MLNKISTSLEQCEIKFDKAGGGIFEGYASKFDGNDSYNDTIIKGAFAQTLKDRSRPPSMLYNHNPNVVIGKYTHVGEDSSGLIVKGEFTPGHTEAQNVRASLIHGAADGLSIGFRIPKGGSEVKEDGGRILTAIDLVEISVVTMPADDAARISMVKSEIETIESMKEAELYLRDSGEFSRSMATCFVSQLKKLYQSDSEAELKQQIAELKKQIETNRAHSTTDQLIAAIRKL
jgi:HK97 family phage prohead protease